MPPCSSILQYAPVYSSILQYINWHCPSNQKSCMTGGTGWLGLTVNIACERHQLSIAAITSGLIAVCKFLK